MLSCHVRDHRKELGEGGALALKSARWLLWVICSPSTETVPWLPPPTKIYANRWISARQPSSSIRFMTAGASSSVARRDRLTRRSCPLRPCRRGCRRWRHRTHWAASAAPGEVAAVIIFFLAGPAARFITGQCCAAGGGEAITMEERP
jgi:hypothetical protein